jgi:hypothetical protein
VTIGIISVPVQAVRAAYVDVGYSAINVLLPQPALSTNFVDVAALRPNIETVNITTSLQSPEWIASTTIPQPSLFAGSDMNALLANQNMNTSVTFLQIPTWIPATAIPQPILFIGNDVRALLPNIETIVNLIALQGPTWIPSVTTPQPVLFAGSDISAILANQNKNISPMSLQGPIWMPAVPLPQPAFSPLQIPYPYSPTVIFNEQDKINQSINVEQNIWEHILRVAAQVFVRAITEALGVVTEAVKIKAIRSIAQSLTVSEAVRKKAILAVLQADGSISETVKKKSIDSIAQSITVSETVKKKAILIITQALGAVTESIFKLRTVSRTITEPSLSVSDSVKKKAIRAISQSLSVSETVKKKAMLTISQAVGSVSETVKKKSIKTITTSLTVSETVKKKAILVINQSLSVSELVVKTTIFIRTISDGVGAISESVLRKLTAVRSILEPSLSISEVVTAVGGAVVVTGRRLMGIRTGAFSAGKIKRRFILFHRKSGSKQQDI